VEYHFGSVDPTYYTIQKFMNSTYYTIQKFMNSTYYTIQKLMNSSISFSLKGTKTSKPPPLPNITIKRYLKFSRKKAVINRFLLLSTLSIAPYFGNLMWPGGTFVIGPFFRGHMDNASQLLLGETLCFKILLKLK
jgi:hypothetical protein